MTSSTDGTVPAVRTHALTRRFEQRARRRSPAAAVTAVDAVDVDIGDGEFFALLGPSGCGKTTMLRMIAGLDFPTEGTIEVFGTPMADVPAHRRPVNTVFQQYALFPHLSVADNVSFGLRMRRVATSERARLVAEALDLVRMTGLDERRPAELSGGQQQRVALARALVNRPRVLLLDEPLGALDQKLRVEMQLELQHLQRELGITFVFVTHDQEEALVMSDRIAVMRAGRILQVGSAEDVYERPVDRFVADFIGEINLIDAVVAGAGVVAVATGDRIVVDTGERAPGSPVVLAVRPERVEIREAVEPGRDEVADSPGHRLAGTVGAPTYLGNSTVVPVDVDWIELSVRVPAGRPVPAPGARVELTWAPDAMTALDGT
ncbi:MAG: ABC transporter ATP-binding protein [Actinomycetota bacterium]